MIPEIERNYYTPDEAFELIGKVVFKGEWEGHCRELTAYPYPKVEEAARNDHRIDMLMEEREKIAAGKLEVELKNFEKEKLAEIERELGEMNNGDKYHVEQKPDYDESTKRHQRACIVEKTMIEAFRDNRVKLFALAANMFIPAHCWEEKETRLSIRMGTIILPQGQFSGTVYAARIDKISFDSWLMSLPEFLDQNDNMDDYEFATAWLRKEISESNGSKRMARDEYFLAAQVERPSLAERSFRKSWDAVVPKNWKKSGRPNNPK